MLKQLFFCGIAVISLAVSNLSGAIVYDNRGLGLADPNLFVPGASFPYIFFDDAVLATGVAPGTPPYAINQIDLGYENTNLSASDTFDIVIQFFNTVNYNAASGQNVGTNPIGGVIRIPGVTVTSGNIGETDYTLTGSLPVDTSGTVGAEIEFVTPGGSLGLANQDQHVIPIFRQDPATDPINVGSSSQFFAYDFDQNGRINGDSQTGDVFTYGTNPPANLYLAIGATAVPEPASISLLTGVVLLLSRRRAKSHI